jgi:predicted alpha/beta hydrolase
MFWYLWGPLLATLLGYIPRWAGLGASLPAPVYWEWRRWCLQPDFYRADWGKTIPVPDLNRFTGTLHHFGIADDPMIPPGQVQKLGMFYPAANSYYRTIHPGDYGLASVGHLALFAPRNKALWSEIMA